MTTIRVTSRNAAGVAVPGARVVVRLVAGPRPTDPGYFTTGDYSITSESHTVTGSTGLKVLVLPPTDGISPDGCFYEIATVTGTNVAKRTIIVPDSGTYDWGDPAIQVLTPVPPEWESSSGPLPTLVIPGDDLTRLDIDGYASGVTVVVAPQATPADTHGFLDLGRPTGSGKRVDLTFAAGASYIGVGWVDDDEQPALLPNVAQTILAGVLTRGDADFAADPFDVTVDVDGTPYTSTVDEDFPLDGSDPDALLHVIEAVFAAPLDAEVVQLVDFSATALTGTIATTAVGSSVTIEITDPGDGDPIGLTGIEALPGATGAVNAVDSGGSVGTGTTTEWLPDHRMSPWSRTHTWPDSRRPSLRAWCFTDVPQGEGFPAKWTAVSGTGRPEDMQIVEAATDPETDPQLTSNVRDLLLNIFLPELTTGGLADGDYLLGATRAGNTFTVGWVPAP